MERVLRLRWFSKCNDQLANHNTPKMLVANYKRAAQKHDSNDNFNEIKWSYDPRSYERNFSNCVEKPKKFRTSTGFEPVTSRYRWDALTNLSCEATDVGSWSFVGCSNIINDEMIYEMKHILNHNCEDHSFTWFHIRSSIYDSFHR